MINFDSEKKGYNREQVRKYIERVKSEYEKIYRENESLRIRLEETERKLAEEQGKKSIVSADRLEDIAMALVDAETEARRIINDARDKAWKIITDAQLGRESSGMSYSDMPIVMEIVTEGEEHGEKL